MTTVRDICSTIVSPFITTSDSLDGGVLLLLTPNSFFWMRIRTTHRPNFWHGLHCRINATSINIICLPISFIFIMMIVIQGFESIYYTCQRQKTLITLRQNKVFHECIPIPIFNVDHLHVFFFWCLASLHLLSCDTSFLSLALLSILSKLVMKTIVFVVRWSHLAVAK